MKTARSVATVGIVYGLKMLKVAMCGADATQKMCFYLILKLCAVGAGVGQRTGRRGRMSYESPITAIFSQMQTQYEDGVLKAVQNYGFDVNKDELIKALMYDRNQYEKGYKDRDAEIIRCEDCKHSYDDIGGTYCSYGVCVDCVVDIDFFCRYGERREKE